MLEQCHLLSKTMFRWLYFYILFFDMEIPQPFFDNLFQCSVKHFMVLFSSFLTQDYGGYPRLSVGSSSIPRQSSMHTSCSVTTGNSFSSLSKPVLPKSLHPYLGTLQLWQPFHHVSVIPEWSGPVMAGRSLAPHGYSPCCVHECAGTLEGPTGVLLCFPITVPCRPFLLPCNFL